MDYQVMECRYNYSTNETDILFAINDRQEAIETAKEFGAGTVVVGLAKRKIRKEFTLLLTKRI